jgi:O-antigen biosynthesis protein
LAGPAVSVVVASRGRAAALSLCLTGLGQVQYHPFEIVVVADSEGRAAAKAHALGRRLKIVACDEANIARARNLGIAAAAGEIVAFIDDDAVPEPDWLTELGQPFEDPGVDAAGGHVIGRNGISLQWGARTVDREGWHTDLPLGDTNAAMPVPPDGGAIRTEGTCMACRRSALEQLGGFDEAFHYFMDDTDLNMRLAETGAVTALAPRARVWHHQAASRERNGDRVPRSLFETGASTAAFLIRHAASERIEAALAAHREVQRKRLLRQMVSGGLVPGDVGKLLQGFHAGAAEGRRRDIHTGSIPDPTAPFRPVHERPPCNSREVLAGWSWQRKQLSADARRILAEGGLVHVLCLSPGNLYHRRRFTEPGYWLQTGGLFGRSRRDGPIVSFNRFARRTGAEAEAGPLHKRFPSSAGTGTRFECFERMPYS